MAIQVALHHRTEYRYDRAVSLGPQLIQLRPAPHCRVPIPRYSLNMREDHTLTWQFDALGNHVARVVIPNKTHVFVTEIDLVADLAPLNPFDFVLEPGYERFPFRYSPELTHNLQPYLTADHAGPVMNAFVRGLTDGQQTQPTVSLLVSVNERVCERVQYTTRPEHGVQDCEHTLKQQSGSCRDSAWLLVQICRQLGFAARFVSGYLIQLVGDGSLPDQLSGPKQDRADLHAWAEVFLPGAGWIGMDATSGLLTAENHIPLACAPTPLETAPISGTVEPSGVDFSFVMSVHRIGDLPSLSQPYTDEQWAAVQQAAYRVDQDIALEDVRLTMGGEPTFVSLDETESAEWNFEALGPLKRTLGLKLIRSLRERTAPGGLLHLGQGKWYPGEELPRWAFFCLSRMDGVPIWQNASLFAREDTGYDYDNAAALTWLQALTRRLAVTAENILSAVDANPGATPSPAVTGYVLPLRRRQFAGRLFWSSQLWFDRPEWLVLSLGDSPVGYRIPVDTVPWVAPDKLVYAFEDGTSGVAADGFVLLPAAPARHPELFAVEPASDPLPAVPDDGGASLLIRPSLCMQVRDGRLHVFLPFVPVLADYLDLVAAIEDTSQHLGIPVWIEGYPPQHDPRLRSFGLTPDPGVLEVNLPPTSQWDDLEALNTVLTEEAHRHRLIPSKFGYDGTHLATGGGSHITIGGPSVLESPILRRPDLLRSMLTFWQTHPSLSYLFAGMYVGPTSQYPRVDEARTDALYELDLSFSHLPPSDCPPYILDGLFRNLLVDVSGNTHRAEFCIDKLFPPEGTGLRAGLLELRAFEMAPHVRMGLLQTLLIRALVALFWQKPFTADLLRWGAALHDRFMLPHFVHADFAEVLAHLNRAGYPFDPAWFAPHLEFRFPRIGTVTADGLTLELRQALEPWNVLAEETTSGGTGRSVDSSLERMQVKLSGIAHPARYIATCNGRRIPLHPTGTPGEHIAGIRYRARRLNAALHPTIPVHTPLTFSLIDTETRQAVARCTYFAGRPDGTLHPSRPTSGEEARARRRERFQIETPSTDPIPLPPEEHNQVFPMTLDLRWPAPTAPATGTPTS